MKNLTPEEQAVFDLIANSENKITQLQISKHERWLGIHPVHEDHLKVDKSGTTLRRVRQIIRNLRINHNIAILSDKDGYWILRSKEEAQEYIKRIEKTAIAQAKSWMINLPCNEEDV